MARRGPVGARPRPKGLSRKSRLRLTAEDVVFTKRTAKLGYSVYKLEKFNSMFHTPIQILREKGHIIPATRIIEHGDPFSRAVLSEDISMGQKWTHYGSRGEYGTLNQNFIFLDNPWSSDASAFVVPYYFDPRNGSVRYIFFFRN